VAALVAESSAEVTSAVGGADESAWAKTTSRASFSAATEDAAAGGSFVVILARPGASSRILHSPHFITHSLSVVCRRERKAGKERWGQKENADCGES